MNFEWDEAKSNSCFEERGFDFAYISHAFLDPNRVIRSDQRHEYGEARLQMLGRVSERLFHVVFTMRGADIRVISARKANLREVKEYENSTF